MGSVEKVGPRGALEGGQFCFFVKFENSVFCTLLTYIGHLGYFIPHLINKRKQILDQSFQKMDLKNTKNEKMPKNSQFSAYFGVFQ